MRTPPRGRRLLRAALSKTYFGRIDYYEETYRSQECCYIGKNGITRNQTDVVVVDWRAPVSSVYYENEIGQGSYDVPEASRISIDLQKKRTYDISDGKLLGFYDNDVAANDELLVKYLSQNKEAVLGDIIATIQKEQNLIIRDSPFKNIIVQGVAGSGKTTVALHRISYLLYNYEDRYKPSEFCIVGSSDMLLNYISSGLPELDVNHVEQMRMDLFIPYLMGKSWKKKYKLVPDLPDAPVKSKLPFVLALEQFLADFRKRFLPAQTVRDSRLGTLLSRENMAETLRSNPGLSLMQLGKLLNARIASRIRFLCPDGNDTLKQNKLKEYRKYFDSSVHKWTELQIYLEFLKKYFPELPAVSSASKGELDLYDAAALGLIRQRILLKKAEDEFSQLIIDEAQDFGEMIYYVLKQMLPGCYFTVMGDVSQNIRYETGMNDWEGLKKALFEKENDSSSFHNGVMVLPVTLTKGLEFDAVILWKPDEDHYGNNAREAKLLYVAITRALHELYLLGNKEISGLMR